MKICLCNNEMKLLETYKTGRIWYCKNCEKFDIEIDECIHKFQMFRIDYGNGNIHIVTKCKYCGQHKKTHKKKETNANELPFFNFDKVDVFSQKRRKILYHLQLKIKDYRIKFKKESNAWNIQKWYYGYLESRMWKNKRDWILKKNNYKCERCGKEAKFIHHKTYERVGYEKPEDLMAVCLSCHGKEHSENPDLNIINQFKINQTN